MTHDHSSSFKFATGPTDLTKMRNRSKISTGYGDDGWTFAGLWNQTAKDSFIIDTLGELDELNCWMGKLRELFPNVFDKDLGRVQMLLFELGVVITQKLPVLSAQDVKTLEERTLELEKDLPELKNFILPHYPSDVHIARAVCRRVERKYVYFERKTGGHKFEPLAIPLLNRLSDYLFVAARHICYTTNKSEVIWSGRRSD